MRSTMKWVIGGAFLLTLAAGCGDDGDTIIVGASLPGKFPGNAASDNNHAFDGNAFSENGETIASLPRVFYSSRANRGIILYTTVSAIGTAEFTLWASYFNGSSVTPPVEIVTVSDPGTPQEKQGHFLAPIFIDGAIVMFYQPSGISGNTDSSRDGDAVILFSRLDVDTSGPGANSDANTRLWWCYFDRSLSSQSSEAHGFGTFDASGGFLPGYAQIVDNDDGDNTITNQPDNKVSDDVETYGIVSDGLHGEGLFLFSTDPAAYGPLNLYEQTDFQHYLVAVWTQLDEVDDAFGGDRADRHLFWARFDFSANGGSPGFTTPTRILTDSSSPESSGNPTDDYLTSVYPLLPTGGGPSIFPLFSTYENSIIFLIGERPDGDQVWQYHHFSGDSTNGFSQGAFISNAVELSPANNPSDGIFPFITSLPMMYGADHNLENLIMIFGHNLNETVDDDADVLVARIDPKITPLQFDPITDIDDEVDLTIAGMGGQDVGEIDSRISRDNDYILIIFNQAESSAPGAPFQLKGVRVATDKAGGTLPPDIAGSTGGVVSISPTGVNASVFSFAFQEELGSSFVPPNESGARGVERSAIQSDNDFMYVVFEQNDDSVGTPVDILNITQFEYTGATLDGTARPIQVDDFPNGGLQPMPNVIPIQDLVHALDDGQGGAVIYYVRDLNFKLPAVDRDLRLYARHYDGISMSMPIDLNSPGLQMTGGEFTALTRGTEDPAGSRHLLFFAEDRYATSGGFPASSIASRFVRFDKLGAGDTFGSQQFGQIHTVDTGQSADALTVGGTSRGGTGRVAVYIQQGGHLYYNEYNPSSDSWLDAGDYIVDNNSETDALLGLVTSFERYLTPGGLGVGETAGALVFWFRFDPDGAIRIHLRIHN
ncbi:MAG: hypothetical protein O7H41_17975 [Planctomycetota bacterium]|nr:hypothetical protein [Planctomycetota bacterium]